MTTDDSDQLPETVFGAGEVPEGYEMEDQREEYIPLWKQLLITLKRDKMALFGFVVVVSFILIAIFAPWIAPYDFEETFTPMQEPNSHSETLSDDGELKQVYHPLGTDSFGHDILTRLIFGSRISLMVAGATAMFAFTVGTGIGLLAGFYRGWVDDILMRYIDFQWAFPELILAIGIIAWVGGLGALNVVIAIGIAYIDDFARIVRGEILSIREKPYTTAAIAVGMKPRRIMIREMLPNAVGPLIVQLTLMIPLAIIAEAGLSFLGLGVTPTTPTWGLALAQGRAYMTQAWWISIMPGLAIMITVLGFNMFGDGLRDSFDVEEVTER
jgi:peptide/nickel transport system permease protein